VLAAQASLAVSLCLARTSSPCLPHYVCSCAAACCVLPCGVLLPQDLDELEQEVDQIAPDGPTDCDCDCGMDAGDELIEARRGMLAVSSQALLTT